MNELAALPGLTDRLVGPTDRLVGGLLDWLAVGLVDASWWQMVLVTLLVTHLTIVSVTLFLHRAQAHRAMDLHPIPSHVFRFWLWLTTGMVTKEWVAIHRKHHAKCETEDDPHSPVTRGIRTVLLEGAELYREEAKNGDTLSKYGHGVPNDWIERNLYSRFTKLGVSLLLIGFVLLFGMAGLTMWAATMLWIPINAAGIINGIGHWWGYRNFEAPDMSSNIVPWGIVIGGEELHNNHHTYPTSAKFSVKPYEFDVGWLYIRMMSAVGWAKVRKTPPRMARSAATKAVADNQTLEALIAHRYEVMAQYAKSVRGAARAELDRLRSQGGVGDMALLRQMKLAARWLHRDNERIPAEVQTDVARAAASSPALSKLVAMREELRQFWTRTNVTPTQLVADLQAWCRRAEESGIAALQEFSLRLRAVT
jgi:stearoyl-CoA desaturase (Delta-9 desaturase)